MKKIWLGAVAFAVVAAGLTWQAERGRGCSGRSCEAALTVDGGMSEPNLGANMQLIGIR